MMVPVYIPVYTDKWETLTSVLSESERNRVMAAYLDHVTFGKEPPKLSKAARGFYEFLVTSPIKNGRGAPAGNHNASKSKQKQNNSENNSKNNSTELNENNSENNSKTIFTKTKTKTDSDVVSERHSEVFQETTQKEKAKAKEKDGRRLEACPECGGELSQHLDFSFCPKCDLIFEIDSDGNITSSPTVNDETMSRQRRKWEKNNSVSQ